jgi:hypothetical protein
MPEASDLGERGIGDGSRDGLGLYVSLGVGKRLVGYSSSGIIDVGAAGSFGDFTI